jgi:hypothetical protein
MEAALDDDGDDRLVEIEVIESGTLAATTEEFSEEETLGRPQSSLRRERSITKRKELMPLPERDVKKQKVASLASPSSRLQEFPNNGFFVRDDMSGNPELRCELCRCAIDYTRLGTIKRHTESQEHTEKLKEKTQAITSSTTLFDFGIATKSVPAGEGKNFPDDHKAWRLKVLATFLEAGVAVNKFAKFRDLLEHNNIFNLTDSSHLSQWSTITRRRRPRTSLETATV